MALICKGNPKTLLLMNADSRGSGEENDKISLNHFTKLATARCYRTNRYQLAIIRGMIHENQRHQRSSAVSFWVLQISGISVNQW
jgi:hypothetical protein